MNSTDLANLIATTPAWITRALANEPRARKVRARLASALTAEQAASLNLTTEHKIATHFKAMRANIEAVLCAPEQHSTKHFTTLGLNHLIAPSA